MGWTWRKVIYPKAYPSHDVTAVMCFCSLCQPSRNPPPHHTPSQCPLTSSTPEWLRECLPPGLALAQDVSPAPVEQASGEPSALPSPAPSILSIQRLVPGRAESLPLGTGMMLRLLELIWAFSLRDACYSKCGPQTNRLESPGTR